MGIFSSWQVDRAEGLRVGPRVRYPSKGAADIEDVLAVDAAARAEDGPWGEAKLLALLRRRPPAGGPSTFLMLADRGGLVCGFVVYECHRDSLRLVRLSVDPMCAGTGVGATLVGTLRGKLDPARRREIAAVVPEQRDYAGVRFLRAMGFGHRRLVPGHFADGEIDGFEMVYSIGSGEADPDA